QRARAARELALEDFVLEAIVAIFLSFAKANDGSEAGYQRRKGLLRDIVVGFAEELAALGVADDDVAAARFDEHWGGDFAGEGAFFAPRDVLAADGDVAALCDFRGGGDCGERRSDHDVAMSAIFDERQKCGEEGTRLGEGFVHLPVAGDDGTAHANSETETAKNGEKDNAETLRAQRNRREEDESFVGEGFDAGEFGAGQKFEGGAATGGDVRNFVGYTGLMDGGDRIASADNGGCTRCGCGSNGFCDCERASGEGRHFEDAHGTVPDDGFGFGDFGGVGGTCFRADIESHLISRSRGDVDCFGGSVGLEFG